jgi:hypothetical protein
VPEIPDETRAGVARATRETRDRKVDQTTDLVLGMTSHQHRLALLLMTDQDELERICLDAIRLTGHARRTEITEMPEGDHA